MSGSPVRDWHAWHEEYDDPRSSLSRRLVVVRKQLDRALTAWRSRGVDRPAVISMCAGEGRDVLPVLAAHPTAAATLVELDPELAHRARADATDRGLHQVQVRTADAGDLASYDGCPPAHVLLACGVFGNIADDDVRRTIAALPHLLVENGLVVWTRGHRGRLSDDSSEGVRSIFSDHGFDEVDFVRPRDAPYRVGVARLLGSPEASPRPKDRRLFTFAR